MPPSAARVRAELFASSWSDRGIAKRLFFEAWADRNGLSEGQRENVWREVRHLSGRAASPKRAAPNPGEARLRAL